MHHRAKSAEAKIRTVPYQNSRVLLEGTHSENEPAHAYAYRLITSRQAEASGTCAFEGDRVRRLGMVQYILAWIPDTQFRTLRAYMCCQP